MKKMGLICLAAVLALGAMGVGYATWTRSVTITGTVNTANYAIVIAADTYDPPISNPDPNGAYVDDAVVSGSSNIDVSVNHGYPGFIGHVGFHIALVSVPQSLPGTVTDIVVTVGDNVAPLIGDRYALFLDGDNKVDAWLTINDVAPDDVITAAQPLNGTIDIEITWDCPESLAQSNTFLITFNTEFVPPT